MTTTETIRHPHATAARIVKSYNSPKMAARETGLTVAQCRAMRDKQAARSRVALTGTDPLIAAGRTRADRLRRLRIERREKALRETLLRAARIARQMGFHVRASKFDGRISSYYCESTAWNGPRFRISDHDIPWTMERELRAFDRNGCGYNGYHGHWILIDRGRSATWLRRAIVLTAAGRGVPGAA